MTATILDGKPYFKAAAAKAGKARAEHRHLVAAVLNRPIDDSRAMTASEGEE